jgi:hypothetical protein
MQISTAHTLHEDCLQQSGCMLPQPCSPAVVNMATHPGVTNSPGRTPTAMMYSSAQCTKGSACSEVACRMDCASARRLVAAITSSTSAPMSLGRGCPQVS